MPKHFYVYNECNKALSATAEFVDLDTEQETSLTVAVPPGNQKMLCATNAPSVSCQAVSDDGSLHWSRQTFQLTNSEYTHVLTCHCVGQDCPMLWPLPTSRQSPAEDPAAG